MEKLTLGAIHPNRNLPKWVYSLYQLLERGYLCQLTIFYRVALSILVVFFTFEPYLIPV